jgi:hypothetical protein
MSSQGNTWRKLLLKSRAPTHIATKKTISSLIKQSEVQEQKRLENNK